MKIDCELMLLYYLNRSIHEPWYSIFIFLYTLLILIAFTFNSLVLWSAYRRIQHTEPTFGNKGKSRYILISHLCTLDVMLTFTMPWTAMDALTKFWPLGFETETICKLTKSGSAAVVYATSMIIVLIAIDSFRQVLYSDRNQLSTSSIFKITPILFTMALFMAYPLFFFSRLISPAEVNLGNNVYSNAKNESRMLLTNSSNSIADQLDDGYSASLSHPPSTSHRLTTRNPWNEYNISDYKDQTNTEKCPTVNNGEEVDWSHVVYCVEDWRFSESGHDPVNRIYYSVFCLTVQYFIPFFTISVLYYQIYRKLQLKSVLRRFILNMTTENARRRENERAKVTNRTLITISLVFCFCWLPLNLIGTLLDAKPELFSNATDHMTIIYMLCHIVGMTSACINPVIYGFFHKHIRQGKDKYEQYTSRKLVFLLYISPC